MAFGIKRTELEEWKLKVLEGSEVVFLTHYWLHPKYPQIKTVTKAGSANLDLLIEWGKKYGLQPEWIHRREKYPHFDLIGETQIDILVKEGINNQLERFQLKKP
ncbi:hypothetical protein [Bacillus pinisoli]|uniref:hypothetical protein n=1 Tax=Bacillus pinisoli TaxID=2901866 RepID=UPI001FF50473|nr:hypothetical protein [Bacillus pinisoli]